MSRWRFRGVGTHHPFREHVEYFTVFEISLELSLKFRLHCEALSLLSRLGLEMKIDRCQKEASSCSQRNSAWRLISIPSWGLTNSSLRSHVLISPISRSIGGIFRWNFLLVVDFSHWNWRPRFLLTVASALAEKRLSTWYLSDLSEDDLVCWVALADCCGSLLDIAWHGRFQWRVVRREYPWRLWGRGLCAIFHDRLPHRRSCKKSRLRPIQREKTYPVLALIPIQNTLLPRSWTSASYCSRPLWALTSSRDILEWPGRSEALMQSIMRRFRHVVTRVTLWSPTEGTSRACGGWLGRNRSSDSFRKGGSCSFVHPCPRLADFSFALYCTVLYSRVQ